MFFLDELPLTAPCTGVLYRLCICDAHGSLARGEAGAEPADPQAVRTNNTYLRLADVYRSTGMFQDIPERYG